MRKELGFVFILSACFCISLVSAISSTEANFIINGCTFTWDGTEIGVAAGECSSGEAFGLFYCETDITAHITSDVGRGCTKGGDKMPDDNNDCCPIGSVCSDDEELGGFRCRERTENEVCVEAENDIECKGDPYYCIWMDDGTGTGEGDCVDSPNNYDCGHYKTQLTCIADKWNISSTGLGTEVCGTEIMCGGEAFSVLESGCGCAWIGEEVTGKCELKKSAVQSYSSIDSDSAELECSSTYALGECVGGMQSVDQVSNTNNDGVVGVDDDDLEECLVALGCPVTGSYDRACGGTRIKLPGFSLFSLIASLVLVCLYYFGLGKFK